MLNASNIQVGGKSSGVPTSSSVNLGAISAASSAAGSSQQAATTTTAQNRPNTAGRDAGTCLRSSPWRCDWLRVAATPTLIDLVDRVCGPNFELLIESIS